jgi:hypothetical protein
MSLKAKLQKLEKAAGLNERCQWCEYQLRRLRAFVRLRKEKGVYKEPPKRKSLKWNKDDFLAQRCEYCGRIEYSSLEGLSEHDKDLLRRQVQIFEKGLRHTAESKQLEQQLSEAQKSWAGSTDEALQEIHKILGERFWQEERKLQSTLKKRFPYICRVEDCPVCRKSHW